VRAVEGFLRRRLAGARAVPFQIDPASGLPTRFTGEADRMRFVSDLPDYIGRGGPNLHELHVERMPSGQGVRLTLGLTVVQAAGEPPSPDRSPEVLADDVRGVRFRYRGLGENGKPGEWTDRWTTVEQLPLLVDIQITGADGRPWPQLMVAPRLAGAYATGAAR
jgi:general secretion pathway protein J